MIPDLDFSRELCRGNSVEKDEVQEDVHDDDDRRPSDEAERDISEGVLDLIGHIRRRVPTRIGERHKKHRHDKSGAEDVVKGALIQGEADGARLAVTQTDGDEDEDDQHLERRDHVLEIGTKDLVGRVDEGEKDDDGDGDKGRSLEEGNSQPEVFRPAYRAAEIIAQGDGRRGDGRSEPDQERDPPREKPGQGMIHLREKMVFSSAAGHHDTGLRVGQGAKKGDQPADQPEEKQGRAGGKADHLETQARKNSRPDHIGDDQGDRGVEAEFCLHRPAQWLPGREDILFMNSSESRLLPQ